MILVIGERVNNRDLTPSKVQRWRQSWIRWGWKAALATEAMVRGQSRTRLDQIVLGEKWVVNLLPPDNKPGSWDQKMARQMAAEAEAWLRGKRCPIRGVVLLGRRVGNMFMPGAAFGTTGRIGDIPVLLVPHPSGRNRFWNEAENVKKAKRWAKRLTNSC